jgi:hypothetical protein
MRDLFHRLQTKNGIDRALVNLSSQQKIYRDDEETEGRTIERWYATKAT